jgi:hypothetical protein
MAQNDGAPKIPELPFMIGGILFIVVTAIVGFGMVLMR